MSPRERALDACLWALVVAIRGGVLERDGYLMRRADELLLAGMPPEERAVCHGTGEDRRTHGEWLACAECDAAEREPGKDL